jgi:flagellar motor switch protein FliM
MASPARQPRIREIDFRRPSKFNREQVRRLEVSHENFCQQISSRMSAELRTEVQIGILNTDQLPYSVVMAEEVPRHALVAVLDVEPLGTEIALVMELGLAFAFTTRLLGGVGEKPAGNLTALTDVELTVARRALGSIVDALSTTWHDLCEVDLSAGHTSYSPMSVQIVPPSEPTLLLNLSAQIDGVVSIMTLVLPHRSLEKVMDKLEQGQYGGSIDQDGPTRAAVHTAVGEVEVETRAEVGAIELPIEQVLAMQPGDVVSLKTPAARGATLFVGDVPAYTVSPGRNGNLRAVQVREPWSSH